MASQSALPRPADDPDRLTAPTPTPRSTRHPHTGRQRRLPSAASVLRRGLLVWGLGHLVLGDRRGWLLMLLQPLSIAGVLLVAAQLIDGTRWLIVLPPLAGLLVVWLAQAIHAHQRAIELRATPGGELQAALFLPIAVAVLTAFWLVGGRHGSPAATLEGYVVAWMSGHSGSASGLYATPVEPADLDATWDSHVAYLTDRVRLLAAQFGPTSGLDPTRPFDNLRFRDPVATGPGRQLVDVDIVRRQRVETMVLGIVPTAAQETVVVERAGTITLSLVEQPVVDWVPFGRLPSFAWKIDRVAIGGP